MKRNFSNGKGGDKKRNHPSAKKREGSRANYTEGKPAFKKFKKVAKKTNKPSVSEDGSLRLNRYLAMAGICSRREADTFIETGCVEVNGVVVSEMGAKVMHGDKVTFNGELIKNETKRYLILNKPKDYITTTKDPQNRKTVQELIKGACNERLYPVGRLDRNTTGLLLFTNDGDLADKLMHPRNNMKKIYHVVLDKNFKPSDLAQLKDGVELEDGFIRPDAVEYAHATDKKQVGVELHSGKNRIVRRIFEHMGYKVIKLDRVMYAGLTKINLPRGKFRFLTSKELEILKRSL